MYVLFFVLHITNNLQAYNLQLVYNVTCNLELCTNRVWYTRICTNAPKKSYIDKIELP